MKFRQWLLKQADRDDPVGDLAQDVKRDPPPVRDWDPADLHWHMKARGADEMVMSAFREAYEEFCAANRLERVAQSQQLM